MSENIKNMARRHPKIMHDDLSYCIISLNIGTGAPMPDTIKRALTKKLKMRNRGIYTLPTIKGYIKTGIIKNKHNAAVAIKHKSILSLTKNKASKGYALLVSSNSFYKSSYGT